MLARKHLLGIVAIIFVGLAIVSTVSFVAHYSTTKTSTISVVHPLNEKGLVVSPNYTVYGADGAPSFETISHANFTVLGTIAYYTFQEQDWLRLSLWVQSVNKAGFVSLVDFWGDQHDFSSLVTMGKRLAEMGVGLLALDEPISIYNLTRAELQSGIGAILQVNPSQHLLINEYRAGVVEDAYAWTANYTTVRIATDQYDDKTVIDLGIVQASEYGKKPAFWLIFAQGTLNFDCYVHLNEWLSYASSKSADVFFWLVDSAGTWKDQWEAVASFLPSEIQQPPTTVTLAITSILSRIRDSQKVSNYPGTYVIQCFEVHYSLSLL